MKVTATFRLLIWSMVLFSLLGVFMLYSRPEFLVTLADQIWACF